MHPVGHTQGFSIAELSEEDCRSVPGKSVHVDVSRAADTSSSWTCLERTTTSCSCRGPTAGRSSDLLTARIPVSTVRLTDTEVTVVDDWDRPLGNAEYEPNLNSTPLAC